MKRFIVNSLAYHQKFSERGIQELGIKDERRNIPIHKLGQQLGREKCSALLNADILTGCDVTSKVGTLRCLINGRGTLINFSIFYRPSTLRSLLGPPLGY